MGVYWALIAAPSIIVVLVARWFWPHEITVKEWGVQFVGLVVSTVLCIGILSFSKFASMSDFDILNGYVTGKNSEHVTCEHDYKCGETCSGTGENRSCVPIYCKLHSYDVDWHVETTVGQSTIERLDDRGLRSPPRWLQAKIGEPAQAEESVTSYLLVDKDRFNTTQEIRDKYKDVELPKYPRVYDYYRFNRIVNETPLDFTALRDYLDNALKTDGATKQLNVTMLVTDKDEDYFDLINEHWSGVRKNDVVLAFGLENGNHIKWFHAMSYGEGQGNQVMLSRLATLAKGQTLDLNLIQRQYKLITNEYERLPAKTFAYLEDSYQPSAWEILIYVLLNIGISVGIAIYMKRNDFF